MFTLASHLYAMIDPAGGHDPVELSALFLEAGAKLMQLRLKDESSRVMLAVAREISSQCRNCGATFIVNDRVDIALLANAHGVHLGQDDLPLKAARRVAGAELVVGISTHSVEQAREAQEGGADYIGFGPMYRGGLKENSAGKGLDNLRAVRTAVRIPIVAIGGITEARVPQVLRAGADAVAIVIDIVKAHDVKSKVEKILALGRV